MEYGQQQWQWLSAHEFDQDKEWWDIYQNSFPTTEQDSKQQLLISLEKNLATIGAYKIQESSVAIIVYYSMQTKNLPFIFLNYFAVAKTARNQGLGNQLLNMFINDIRRITRYAALVWEIEDPDDAKNSQERQIRQRRLAFYRREGGKLFNHKFIQPPIDGVTYIPMRLMYNNLIEPLNIHLYEKDITEIIYFNKYQKINAIHSKILQDLMADIFKEQYER